jgi:hypothetical protein
MADQVFKKALAEVLSVLGRVAPAPGKGVGRCPVVPASLGQGLRAAGCLALGGLQQLGSNRPGAGVVEL